MVCEDPLHRRCVPGAMCTVTVGYSEYCRWKNFLLGPPGLINVQILCRYSQADYE